MEAPMQTDMAEDAITLEMSVRYNERDGHIHLIAVGQEGFMTTVNNNTENDRGHPDLFLKLAKCLRRAGVPHPGVANE
jgi:hypothetical protein